MKTLLKLKTPIILTLLTTIAVLLSYIVSSFFKAKHPEISIGYIYTLNFVLGAIFSLLGTLFIKTLINLD